jgi:catecholate siderophore receptor
VDTGPLSHTLITGFEIGRQTGDFERFDNEFEGIDGVAPTPLLSPNAEESAPQQNTVVSRPNSTADIFGAYVTDEIRFAPHWSLDTGLRFDRYTTVFGDGLTDVSFHRVDTGWTPKVALVFQPTDGQTYYASYTTSFDPAVSYLTLAPDSVGPPPQTAKNYELGAKVRWLGGSLLSTFAAFRIDSQHITVSDPDDPTLQEMPGTAQRVQGVELTTSGRIGSHIEINANYTFIDPEITASSVPAEIGKQIPNAARQTANLWLEYEPDEKWELAVGVNYVGHRYADNLNTANVPGYVVLNNMIGYQLTPKMHLQLNIQNLTGANYYTGAYYSDATENHVLPGQGRVFTLNTRVSF